MPTILLFLEFIGTPELLVIALVALIVFGPRKLPEIGRMLGKSLAEFKRASEDFKRTWEFEVETERRQQEARAEAETRAAPPQLGAETTTPAAWEVEAGTDATPAATHAPALTGTPTPAPMTVPRGSAGYAGAADLDSEAAPASGLSGPAAHEPADEPAAGRAG